MHTSLRSPRTLRRVAALCLFWAGLSCLALPVAAQPPTSELDVPSNLDIHFIDREDGGDDPWKPGCHWHFGTKECSAPEFFFMGDYCSGDGRILFEWTDRKCHEPKDDIREYDCNQLCQEKYGAPGRCVVVPKKCKARRVNNPDATRDSAFCQCKGQD